MQEFVSREDHDRTRGGLFLVELWIIIRGYVDPGDVRAFAEAIVAEADSGRDFETSFRMIPYRGDAVWGHPTAYREAGGHPCLPCLPCLFAQILDDSCGSVELADVAGR
ncbi:hypothetical protein [Nocardia sp. NPDC046763]|uniref:hypothetical protein n=1 Tax=Nocardia sp. NPDC046763 TaxID=3155256 RepID=UPI0033D2A6B2